MTVLNLPMPPSTNALFVNRKAKGKRGRKISDTYQAWLDHAGYLLNRQHPPKIKGPVRLEYRFEDGGSRCDIDNLAKATGDILVKHGVIEGDGPSVVREINMRWAMGVKGVSITVVNLRPQEAAALEYIGEAE